MIIFDVNREMGEIKQLKHAFLRLRVSRTPNGSKLNQSAEKESVQYPVLIAVAFGIALKGAQNTRVATEQAAVHLAAANCNLPALQANHADLPIVVCVRVGVCA